MEKISLRNVAVKCLLFLIICLALNPAGYSQPGTFSRVVIAEGHMPSTTKDKNNIVHIVYGIADSIMHVFTKDGKNFSSPEMVGTLPGLFATATRGPQIAAVPGGLVITASTKNGNIFSFRSGRAGKWSRKRVNDYEGNAKEGLMDLAADGSHVYALWLGVNNPKGQKVYGAQSADGGRTWKKNVVVYASPSGTVCECCKPSVAVKGNKIFVLFRNYLDGNRDLYLTTSTDGGNHFGEAKKLGRGSWKLNGCPMDGGGLALAANGTPQTTWRRESKIYAATTGLPEREIGEGKSCSIATFSNENYYAWTQDGNIIVRKPGGIKISPGAGSLPVLQALNSEKFLCVWENENRVEAAVLNL